MLRLTGPPSPPASPSGGPRISGAAGRSRVEGGDPEHGQGGGGGALPARALRLEGTAQQGEVEGVPGDAPTTSSPRGRERRACPPRLVDLAQPHGAEHREVLRRGAHPDQSRHALRRDQLGQPQSDAEPARAPSPVTLPPRSGRRRPAARGSAPGRPSRRGAPRPGRTRRSASRPARRGEPPSESSSPCSPPWARLSRAPL